MPDHPDLRRGAGKGIIILTVRAKRQLRDLRKRSWQSQAPRSVGTIIGKRSFHEPETDKSATNWLTYETPSLGIELPGVEQLGFENMMGGSIPAYRQRYGRRQGRTR